MCHRQFYNQLLLPRALWMFHLFQTKVGFNNSMCLFNQPSTATALLLSPLAPVKTMDPSERQQSVPVGSGTIAAIAISTCCFLLLCSILIILTAFVYYKRRKNYSLAMIQEQQESVVHCNNVTPTSTAVEHTGSRSASLHLRTRQVYSHMQVHTHMYSLQHLT